MIPLLTSLLALAAPAPPDVLEEALVEAIDTHTTELSLGENAPDIYHLRYHLLSLDQVSVQASLGHVVRANETPVRSLSVELRVGDPSFDNTGFGGWENGFGQVRLPADVTGHALSLAAWRLTDRSYKQALEQYARKRAQFTPPPEHPGDYTLMDPVVHRDPPRTPGDVQALTRLAEALSAPLSAAPGVEVAKAFVGHEAGYHLIVDSGGHRVRRPRQETSVRAVLHVRTDDGMLLTDSRLWSVSDPTDLPPRPQMVAEVEAMRDDLVALARAPLLDAEVVGPVVFQDRAALTLFEALLLPQLEGTPPEVPFDTFLGDMGSGQGSSVRLRRRVLPLGWSVVDDPTRPPAHPGTFTHDYEGTPAQRVELVEDGIVQEVFMSRVPRRDRGGSNGHARGRLGQRLGGRPVATAIQPDRSRSRKRVHKRALRLARAYERDWYLRVDRFQAPPVRRVDQDIAPDRDDALPRPVRLTRVYKDGREELLRGGRFSNVQRFALRDIQAAGPLVEGTLFLPFTPDGSLWRPTGGMPTWMRVPEVVVGELEILPTPPDPRDTHVLPPPRGFTAAP